MKYNEKDIEEIYLQNPHLIIKAHPRFKNSNWITYKHQFKLSETLRCDLIFQDTETKELHLVEIKKHYADFSDISQVMSYYAACKKIGLNITNVYILAKGFSDDLKLALSYCNITPIEINFKAVETAYKDIDEVIRGIYKNPNIYIEPSREVGEFPHIPLEFFSHMSDIEKVKVEEAYKQYKFDFYNTPLKYYFEIWEFTVIPNKCYLMSIRHDGEAIHFNNYFPYMTKRQKNSIGLSTRLAAWQYYKSNIENIPYNNFLILTYRPFKHPLFKPDPKSVNKYKEKFIHEDYY